MPSHKDDGRQTAAEILQLHRARPGNFSAAQVHKRRRLLMGSVASHGWQLFSSDWDQTTNSLIGTEFNKFKLWQSALLVVISCNSYLSSSGPITWNNQGAPICPPPCWCNWACVDSAWSIKCSLESWFHLQAESSCSSFREGHGKCWQAPGQSQFEASGGR